MSDHEFKMADGAAQPLADHLGIMNCLNQYCHVVDRGSVDEIVALFAEDAVLLTPYQGNGRFEGRAAIRAWYENYDREVRAARRHRRHTITSPFITINGDAATAVCYLDSSTILIASNVINVSSGRYDDKLVKVNGTWLFKERIININHVHRIESFDEPS
ncbi:MAG: nuclear transport factor 2 family protein [Rhodospirillaceae bacterium]|jgi:hypothetical protein|nr:nuclear transport factor 2 family protein [Rhodospirillaceae bacterium]MBT3495211.1 nuclear transport factor 2 family protein [Rhodospirillaceae bacterium]MBT3780534.1 nuclear transport factor 2 family protein [Rhodospirillaceae bacterium]MBT3979303.1 nuclear transport factor 2 family protein [Rhodospirillaceae bacterium]MBT4170093.1 nuclear transport factor 2 family protein [Rhodospirillaceae bacterium]